MYYARRMSNLAYYDWLAEIVSQNVEDEEDARDLLEFIHRQSECTRKRNDRDTKRNQEKREQEREKRLQILNYFWEGRPLGIYELMIMMKRNGEKDVSRQKTSYRLNQLVKEGYLTKDTVSGKGTKRTLYQVAEKEKAD